VFLESSPIFLFSNYPSSRCATAANLLYSNVDIFRRSLRSSIFETALAIVTRSFVLRFNYLANLNFSFLTYFVTKSDFTDMYFSLNHKSILSICSGYDVLKSTLSYSDLILSLVNYYNV
jgi:hypothetical protein